MSAQVFIVTGASRGIGLAIAQCLLREQAGSKLVAVARSKAPLDELAASADAGRVATLAGDLSDSALGQQAVDLALSKFGRLDGVVINHGTLDPVGRIADADVEQWRQAFDVNVFSGIAMVCLYCLLSTSLSKSRKLIRVKQRSARRCLHCARHTAASFSHRRVHQSEGMRHGVAMV